MLRWSISSFVPSKASICGILNFVGKGKCQTPTVNGDSVCCTRASIDTRARPFTASFMWPSSRWMPLNAVPKIVPLFKVGRGLDCHLHRSCPAPPRRGHLQWICRGYVSWSDYFLLHRQHLGGRRCVAVPPVEWYCVLHGPVVPLVGVALVW